MAPKNKGIKRQGAASNAPTKKIAQASVAMGAADDDGDTTPLSMLVVKTPSMPANLVLNRDATKMRNLLAYRASDACKKACI